MEGEVLANLIASKNPKVSSIRARAIAGDLEQLHAFEKSLLNLLQSERHRQLVCQQITQLIVSANSSVVNDVFQNMLPQVAQLQSMRQFREFMELWVWMYDGSSEKKAYPDFKKLFKEHTKVRGKMTSNQQEWLNIFLDNFAMKNNRKIQFFDDESDSLCTDAIESERMVEILSLTFIEFNAIRNRLTKPNLTEQEAEEIFIKLKNFLTLTPKDMPQNIQKQYQLQKNWVEKIIHFDEMNRKYESYSPQAILGNLSARAFAEALNKSRQKVDKRAVVLMVPIDEAEEPPSRTSRPLSIFEKRNPKRNEGFLQVLSRNDLESVELEIVVHRTPHNQKIFSATDGRFSHLDSNGLESKTSNNFYKTAVKPSKRKLSQFSEEKRQRKMIAPVQELSKPLEYLMEPFCAVYPRLSDLTVFRRNCFDSNAQIYRKDISVKCNLKWRKCDELEVVMEYTAESDPWNMDCQYLIPKCFSIFTSSKISKHLTISGKTTHRFVLQTKKFPLDICILELTGRNLHLRLALPITILNFTEFRTISSDDWISLWQEIASESHGVHLSRHLQLEFAVIDFSSADSPLKNIFVRLPSIQGYSCSEFGALSSQGPQSQSLMRLSVRYNNVVSLELRSMKPVFGDEKEFLQYFLDMWVVLLSKIEI